MVVIVRKTPDAQSVPLSFPMTPCRHRKSTNTVQDSGKGKFH
jgi:hypothetical protein